MKIGLKFGLSDERQVNAVPGCPRPLHRRPRHPSRSHSLRGDRGPCRNVGRLRRDWPPVPHYLQHGSVFTQL